MPMGGKKAKEGAADDEERRMRFRLVPVFDVSQTGEVDGGAR